MGLWTPFWGQDVEAESVDLPLQKGVKILVRIKLKALHSLLNSTFCNPLLSSPEKLHIQLTGIDLTILLVVDNMD